jgi:aryl-alcohol dehydrogenase-like predicted oxidoreductase
VLAALERGVTLFDTAALYGFGANETLVGRVLRSHRTEVVLATKGGMAGVESADGVKRIIDGRPAAIRINCEDSLRRLGADVVDLYYLHRVDLKNRVPVEDSVGALSRLVKEGKVRALGLSEDSPATLRRARAVHPIAALQSEYSLWTRHPERGILDVCRELGVAFVAFSPLGRGYLTGTLGDVSALGAKDIRRPMPRFLPENYAINRERLGAAEAVARDAGCTMAQLALAWLLRQSDQVIPIPGTTSVAHLEENLGAARVSLSDDATARVGELLDDRTVRGARYAPETMAELDSETG